MNPPIADHIVHHRTLLVHRGSEIGERIGMERDQMDEPELRLEEFGREDPVGVVHTVVDVVRDLEDV